MKILLLGIWVASVPVAYVLGEPHLRHPFDLEAEDTCVQPFEVCNESADCCQETHKWCNPNNIVNRLLGDQWCVTCRGDYDCPGTVMCENPGTERANCDMASLETVEGMALIRQGYDIFLSDPLRSKSITDAGIQTTKIFNFDFLNGSHDHGNDFPKGFTASDDYPSCVSGFESTSITSSSEMSSMISDSASVSSSVSIPTNAGALDLGAGVGSGSYSSSTSAALNKEMTVTSKAECKIRVLRMIEYGPYPDLSTELINWFESDFNGSNYLQLFQIFGTHVAHELTIGAVFGATTTVTEAQQSSFTSESESLEATLSVGIPFLFNVDTTTASEESRAANHKLTTSGVESTIWSVGGQTVASNEAFYAGAQTNPAPLIYKEMESLCEIIQTKNINNFNNDDCYESYIPYCKHVMEGTEFNCDVMIGQGNNNFDCVFDSHCSGRNICTAGTCNARDIVAFESMRYPGSYLDAGGDRKVWTAPHEFSQNNFRKWKIIDLGDGVVGIESMRYPGSYLDAGGDRKVWTAPHEFSQNNFRKWKIIDLGDGVVGIESMRYPGSYLDAGGDRKVWTAPHQFSENNFRKWKIIDLVDGAV